MVRFKICAAVLTRSYRDLQISAFPTFYVVSVSNDQKLMGIYEEDIGMINKI